MKKIIFSLMALFVTAFTFTSCESVPMPYNQPGTGGTPAETIEPAGSGTLEDPYNIAALLKYAATLGAGESSPKQIYFKGKVVSIKEITDATSYGNATFYVSDTGTAQNQFYVYRCLGLNNKKVTSTDIIKVGDEVVVCGIITNYNGTLETASNKAYIYSINGEGGNTTGGDTPSTVEPKGTGTEADPFNVAGVIAYINTLGADVPSDKEVYIKGKVLANNTTAATITSYGNMTFTMVDEGSETPVFTAFQVFGPNKEKFTSVDQIKTGQTVVVCGKVLNYKGNTPETVGKGASYVVSIDGNGSSTGGGSTEPTNPTTNEGITIDGTTLTLTNSSYTAGSTSTTIDLNTLGWANASDATSYTAEDGTTITFGKGTNENNAPKFYTATKGVRMYANNTLTITAAKNIAKVVITCDTFSGTNYVGNATATMTADGGTIVYTNTHSENKGGVQCRPQTITITYAQ